MLLFFILTLAEPSPPIQLGSMLPFGEDYGDQIVSPSLNGASPALSIPGGSIPFYGNQETILYVRKVHSIHRLYSNLGLSHNAS